MLLLTFQIKDDWYGIDINHVIEVMPMVELRKIPHGPPYVAGLFNYRGVVGPVIDLTELFIGEPSRKVLSSRIMVVSFPGGDEGHVLGLLAEHVTETIQYEEEDFKPSGITIEGAPFLGDVLNDERGMIRRVKVEDLLPEQVREMLFRESHGAR